MSVKLSNMIHSSKSVTTLLATLRCKPEEESLQMITWHRTPTIPLSIATSLPLLMSSN